MNPMTNTAIKAARQAGELMMRAQDRLKDIKVTEKAENDYVTEVDQHAEAVVIETLRKAYPDHGILAEESGHDAGDDFCWVIDPIDGTRNFMHGLPHFCVSIGLQHKGKTELGVIYDPVRQELFVAERGSGAHVNNKRMRVSAHQQIDKSLLATGFPFRHNEKDKQRYFELFNRMLPVCGDFRRAGSAALDLAYVAAGRLDGFFELSLKPWDVTAGALMVKEAGGLLGAFDGSENFLQDGSIIAANPKIFKALLQFCNNC